MMEFNNNQLSQSEPHREPKTQIKVDSLFINRHDRTVLFKGEPRRLTSSEFDILWYLATHAGETVSRDELFENVLRTEYDGLNRSVDNRIARVRRKLGDKNRNERLIVSIRSEGYMLAHSNGLSI